LSQPRHRLQSRDAPDDVRELALDHAMLGRVPPVESDESLGEATNVVSKLVEHDIRAALGRLAGIVIDQGWQNLLNPLAPTIEISEYVYHLHGVHFFAPLEYGGQRRSDSIIRTAEATRSSNHP